MSEGAGKGDILISQILCELPTKGKNYTAHPDSLTDELKPDGNTVKLITTRLFLHY